MAPAAFPFAEMTPLVRLSLYHPAAEKPPFLLQSR
jgi:hypothetical protein